MRVQPPPRRRAAAGPPWHRRAADRVRDFFAGRRVLKYALATVAAFFVAGYLLVTVLFFPGFGRSPIVTVPDFGGRTLAQAARTADRAGLEVEPGGELPNPRVRRGRVLMQTPLPGEEVTRGTEVRLVLSAGPDVYTLPPVEGMTRPEIIALLRRFGYRPAIRRVRDRSAEGTILGLQPASGRRVPAGSVVRILVSAGPPKVLVPEVVGLPVSDAGARLRGASLEAGALTYDELAAEAPGTVLAQRPAAGDSLAMGGRVRLTVAGPDPAPPPPPDPAPADTIVLDAEPPPAADDPAATQPPAPRD